MNDLIRVKLKEIVKLQDIFKDIINQNVEKLIMLVNIHCLLFFKGYT